MTARYKMGAVVYDQATRSYRKANVLTDMDRHVWAIYQDGNMLCVCDDSAAARDMIQQLNDQPAKGK